MDKRQKQVFRLVTLLPAFPATASDTRGEKVLRLTAAGPLPILTGFPFDAGRFRRPWTRYSRQGTAACQRVTTRGMTVQRSRERILSLRCRCPQLPRWPLPSQRAPPRTSSEPSKAERETVPDPAPQRHLRAPKATSSPSGCVITPAGTAGARRHTKKTARRLPLQCRITVTGDTGALPAVCHTRERRRHEEAPHALRP